MRMLLVGGVLGPPVQLLRLFVLVVLLCQTSSEQVKKGFLYDIKFFDERALRTEKGNVKGRNQERKGREERSGRKRKKGKEHMNGKKRKMAEQKQ